MSMTNYIIVMKALEDGKFLITFPDFEGLTATADSEENIQSVATEAIKAKLTELKRNNLVIPEAKKMKEVSSTLNEGEFTTYVPVKEDFDFKAAMNTTMATLKDKESLKKGTEDLKNKANELTNNIPKGSENIFGIIGGVIAIINTFLVAVFSVKVPIFGSYSIGFFKGLGILADFSKEVKNIQAILLFSGILFIAFAGLLIYSSIIKNKNILLYSIIGNVIFLVIFYIILFVKLPGGEASEYISVSFFKILFYLISLALAFVTYFALNKSEQSQISLNDGDDRNEEGL
ncbi:type II toxin-antitoxin system HicB family antitoxin [Fusobacterium pseudoperiodonticum]|uniref:type II toxin-antitoxin system HicB family antitoxin n=1 Tax=Fusobacterium pseudoperiodonticum TaxID=2663009 RepID=UPI000C1C5937|nr:type II toxin-antitoxin system HicB family antitoxin [Fusobacterium pseudoperiodonticum]ATV63512.1 HicB family protein [Fusobacterium pseudoperiodonticum]ATV67518.1 HicB family protein [Fusobacterium pseudoperiodonticum]